jgi:pyroglutamyl-peptidase
VAIMLGLWPGEPCIRLERFALNWNAFEIPDNAGAVERGPVAAGSPLAFPSGLPVERIVDDLLQAGIPARASSSAGNFLCNATFFSALRTIAERRLPTRASFVHVPYLPEQVAQVIRAEERLELHQRADLASMALETQLAGLRRIMHSARDSQT